MSRKNADGMNCLPTPLTQWMDTKLYPAVYRNLPNVFPEFGFVDHGSHYQATQWPANFALNSGGSDPRRICVYANRPYWIVIQGSIGLRILDHLNGGRKPAGKEFGEALAALSQRAGIECMVTQKAQTVEELEHARALEARLHGVEVIARFAHEALMSETGTAARDYLHGRGVADEDIRAFEIGYYPSVAAVRDALRAANADMSVCGEKAGLLRGDFAGKIVFPANDERGRINNLYSRAVGTTPKGEAKYLGLKGPGSKYVPLCLDRVLAAKQSEVILVEGVLDAIILQKHGETRAVAIVAGVVGAEQVKTLVRRKINRAFICGDPDAAGDTNTPSNIKALESAGIETHVLPRLPEKVDPDEFILKHGIDAWRERVAHALPANLFLVEAALKGVGDDTPEATRREAVGNALAVLARADGPSASLDVESGLNKIKNNAGIPISALRSQLKTLKAEQPSKKANRREEVRKIGSEYEETPDGIIRKYWTQDGERTQLLSNFGARITKEITRIDETEQTTRTFEISCVRRDRRQLVAVKASEFGNLDWVLELLGGEAVIAAGKQAREHLRVGIQVLSGSIPKQVVWTHTGWRKIEGESLYLHGGGAIGAAGEIPGIEVDLSNGLERYCLPPPPTGERLVTAIRASLAFLEVGPRELTVPLLSLVYRSVLDEADYVGFLFGPTGELKSATAGALLGHFGKGFDGQHLPASFTGTAKSLPVIASILGHSLCVMDDFKPEGSLQASIKTVEKANSLIRSVGNLQGNSGLTRNNELRHVKRPRGTILVTGELFPGDIESIVARTFALEVGHGTINRDRLAAVQDDAREGLLAEATAGFIQFLAPRRDEILKEKDALLKECRKKLAVMRLHARTPDILANMFWGDRLFIDFAVEKGALTAGEAEALKNKFWDALLVAARKQVAVQGDSKPFEQFIELVGAAVRSGQAHIEDMEGQCPPRGKGLGWVERDRDPHVDWWPSGSCIGYVDGENLYLDATAALAAAEKQGQILGTRVGLSAKALGKALNEEGKLVSTELVTNSTYAVRRPIKGHRLRVLHLRLADVFPPAERVDHKVAPSATQPPFVPSGQAVLGPYGRLPQ